MKPKYKIWYHPYNRLEEIESVESYANCERDARWFARAFGLPFKVKVV